MIIKNTGFVRQEVDEPPLRVSNWRLVPCGPIVQDKNSRTIERGGWVLPR